VVVRGCLLRTVEGCYKWHVSGTAVKDDAGYLVPPHWFNPDCTARPVLSSRGLVAESPQGSRHAGHWVLTSRSPPRRIAASAPPYARATASRSSGVGLCRAAPCVRDALHDDQSVSISPRTVAMQDWGNPSLQNHYRMGINGIRCMPPSGRAIDCCTQVRCRRGSIDPLVSSMRRGF
jgi:hypothetical protein